MSKKHCKYECEFLHEDLGIHPKCLIYKKKVKYDGEGFVRLKRCVRESREWKIGQQIQDIKDFYDAFVCETDIMFDNLYKLMKGEK
jgi:hypothetical protein